MDLVTAAIIRLAADGLWLVELFGLAPPDAKLTGKVLEALENISRRNTAR
jgi:hypothetical protein